MKRPAILSSRPASWRWRPPSRRSRHLANRISQGLVFLAVAVGAAVFMMPFLWMVSTSLKPFERIFASPPEWIPIPPHWENYVEATTVFPFWRYALNTLFIAVVATVGKLLSGSLTAYAFARLRWPGRDFWFMVMLGTIMLPQMVTLLPTYMLFKTLGWLNTFLPLTIPFFFASTSYSVFLIRQYFLTIPHELSEAARIDGASELRIYWQVIMPLAKPVFGALAVLSFVRHWNELLEPLIYLTKPNLLTLSVGLLTFRSEFGTYYHLLMAASVLALIPILVLFFLTQRYFIEGIALTGIKG